MGTVPPANGATGAPNVKSLSAYAVQARTLSERLVATLRPIRVLDAVHWGPEVEQTFFAAGASELPPVTSAYYAHRPLPFDPPAKQEELTTLEREVDHRLGGSPAGRMLARRCQEYREVVRLLAARGTRLFAELSRSLFGRATDPCQPMGGSLAEFARSWQRANVETDEEPLWDARQTATTLASRLGPFFGNGKVRVRLCESLMADAVACGDSLRVRGSARFTERDVRLLEVHEGWVHLGTTLNGREQPICTFLTKGPPSSTLTQEGLAVLTEILTGASHPGRIRRLGQRVEAVARAEAGADFRDVYRYWLEEGYEPSAAYRQTARVFRGSLPAGVGPFTKDLCYCKGLMVVSAYFRRTPREGRTGQPAFLFCGKTSLGEADDLTQLAEEGLLAPPRYVPSPFVNGEGMGAGVQVSTFGGHVPIPDNRGMAGPDTMSTTSAFPLGGPS
jgi:uncharacterized protein (TIGR02421 family)